MKRFFNTTGPCVPGKHYLLPARDRCTGIFNLIAREQYFVIHAARQSGKTTLLKSLAAEINAGTDYKALYCSLESAQGISDPREGLPAVCRTIAAALKTGNGFDSELFLRDVDYADFTNILKSGFQHLCAGLDRPLIMLFDEVDCLSNGTLITFLRQLRDGYVNRPESSFIHSCALVGMRDIRDYKARIRPDRNTLGSASPFNVAAESLTLRNFTGEEVGALYAQHTSDTGQEFPAEAVEQAFWWSQGQPWLVNALAREVVDKILEGDYSRVVESGYFDDAAERLIMRRDTHIDSLIERLREERVRRIVEPVLTGDNPDWDSLDDDVRFTLDLGLLRNEGGVLLPSNPVYREVIARALSWNAQEALARTPRPPTPALYMDGSGMFDMNCLLRAFQEFWRENSESWAGRFDYSEAAPHLMLMAFLQRVVNGGGRVDREYALGRGRIDLLIRFDGKIYPVEIKVRRGVDVTGTGQEQLSEYMDTCGAHEGWLVIFDRRPGLTWDERIDWDTVERGELTIHVVRC